MAINPVSSTYSNSLYNVANQPTQQKPEALEATKGPDHDGDRDDTSVQATQQSAQPTPTTNTFGETVGTLLHTTA